MSESSECPGDAGAWTGGAGRAHSLDSLKEVLVVYVIISPPLLHPSDRSCSLLSEPEIPSSEVLLPWEGVCAVISLSLSFGFIITSVIFLKITSSKNELGLRG